MTPEQQIVAMQAASDGDGGTDTISFHSPAEYQAYLRAYRSGKQ